MEKLKMHTPDLAEENYKKLAELFPNKKKKTSPCVISKKRDQIV